MIVSGQLNAPFGDSDDGCGVEFKDLESLLCLVTG